MAVTRTVVYEGERYKWDGIRWLTDSYLIVSEVIAARLNECYAEMIEADDAAVTDIQQLLDRAKMARDAKSLTRAKRLVERVLRANPHHLGAAAVLSSVLREQLAPDQALAVADRFPGCRYTPLLTSRAAALCDLGRWAEALADIRATFDLDRREGRGPSIEALNVHTRIRAGAPHLFGA